MPKSTLLGKRQFKAIRPYPVHGKPLAALPIELAAKPTVDLRPTIQQLNLKIRAQGGRGTCSVFATTFLLEYMYLTRQQLGASDLSEEYLNYVSNLENGAMVDGDFFDCLNNGYQRWGIVPETTVPYCQQAITSLPSRILADGSRWPKLTADFVRAWDSQHGASQDQLEKTLAYLDGGTPVAAGLWWPKGGQWQTVVVKGVEVMAIPPFSQKEQVLADGHSIGLVGYRRDSAFDGGGYFVYRNSWGEDHWDHGYGYMPFGYVLNYANDLLAYRSASITCPAVGPAAVAAGADSLDVIVADTAGRVMAAAWDQQVHGGRWRGWWPLLSGQTKPGAAMTVVARDRNKLDVFGVGTDGRIYTAASDSGVDNGLWRGWWPIVNGAAPLGAPVAAVARDPNKLDVFVVGNDGGIYTAAWDQHVAQGKWRGWWRITQGAAVPGSPVSAVARDPNKLDVFVVGNDRGIYTAAWDQHVAQGQWRGWWRILQGAAVPGSLVSVVARDPNKLDVFVTGTDGGIYTAAWDQNVAQGQWRGWWRIVQGAAALGSPVSVVARDPNKLDVFVVGTDGGIYTAAWDQNVAQGQWRGWWRIPGLTAKLGATISVVARDPNKLDVLVAGTDGQVYTAAWDQHVADGKWRGWWHVWE